MKFKNLSIIGGGPNAVYALDILLKNIFKEKIKSKKKIFIFEPTGLFGCGKTHSKNLDKNILLNRVAGQISLGAYPFLKFPKKFKKFDYNFMEWKSKQKNPNIYKLKSTDWPPRAVFGKAMQYKFFDLMYLFHRYTEIKIELVFDNHRLTHLNLYLDFQVLPESCQFRLWPLLRIYFLCQLEYFQFSSIK